LEYLFFCVFYISFSTTEILDTCVIFVSTNGNDTTADGSQNKPFLTIQTALNSVKEPNCSAVYVKLIAGTYYSTFMLNTTKIRSLFIEPNTEDVVFSNLEVKYLLQSLQNFTFSLSKLSCQNLNISGTENAFFSSLTLDNVSFAGINGSWYLSARSVVFQNTIIDSKTAKSICLDASGPDNANGTIQINRIMWNGTNGLEMVLQSATNISIVESVFANSIGTLISVPSDLADPNVNITMVKVLFDQNHWNSSNSDLIELPSSFNNISFQNCSFNCNNGTISRYPPIFSTTIPVSIINPITDPKRPIACSTNGTFLEQSSKVYCLPCEPGSYSANYTTCIPCPISYQVLDNTCQPCPSGSFSTNNVKCTACPIFSSQQEAATAFCTCFTGIKANEENYDTCNNQFWGFVVGAIYLVLIVSIIVFWKRRSVHPSYERVDQ